MLIGHFWPIGNVKLCARKSDDLTASSLDKRFHSSSTYKSKETSPLQIKVRRPWLAWNMCSSRR